MLKDEATRNEFIKLRAQNLSYRKIQVKINVSRPTLIKWSRMYAKEIERERKRLERKFQREEKKRQAKWAIRMGKILLKWLESERK